MRIFDYAVLYIPNENDAKAGAEAAIIAEGRFIALDQSTAQFKVARLIPEKWVPKFDDLQIAVRPF